MKKKVNHIILFLYFYVLESPLVGAAENHDEDLEQVWGEEFTEQQIGQPELSSQENDLEAFSQALDEEHVFASEQLTPQEEDPFSMQTPAQEAPVLPSANSSQESSLDIAGIAGGSGGGVAGIAGIGLLAAALKSGSSPSERILDDRNIRENRGQGAQAEWQPTQPRPRGSVRNDYDTEPQPRNRRGRR